MVVMKLRIGLSLKLVITFIAIEGRLTHRQIYCPIPRAILLKRTNKDV